MEIALDKPGGGRIGKARLALSPRLLAPSITALLCKDAYESGNTDVCTITIHTLTSGYMNVDILDGSGTAVRNISNRRNISYPQQGVGWRFQVNSFCFWCDSLFNSFQITRVNNCKCHAKTL